MFHFRHTPLAWKNLTHNVRRLMIAVSGVTFAVVLMFMERGFQNALFDSTVELVRNFRADIVLINSSRYSLSSSSRFPLTAISLAQVATASRKLVPGGGALPLEAQRLGLEAYTSDLNPVAVLINKAMNEIPPKFAGKPPVNPESAKGRPVTAHKWQGAQGLAEDVRYYGQWIRERQ